MSPLSLRPFSWIYARHFSVIAVILQREKRNRRSATMLSIKQWKKVVLITNAKPALAFLKKFHTTNNCELFDMITVRTNNKEQAVSCFDISKSQVTFSETLCFTFKYFQPQLLFSAVWKSVSQQLLGGVKTFFCQYYLQHCSLKFLLFAVRNWNLLNVSIY